MQKSELNGAFTVRRTPLDEVCSEYTHSSEAVAGKQVPIGETDLTNILQNANNMPKHLHRPPSVQCTTANEITSY